ncbi:MAG: restriction endonuclease [Dechloromonas sp.]|nr:restriction endonuclease [Dechloromonas sp.]
MARRKTVGKKNESFIEVLLASPWQVSAGAGVAVFIGLKWILPALAGGSMFLKPVSAAASSVAWLFAGGFFVIAVVVFAKRKAEKVKPQAVEHVLGVTSIDQLRREEPSWSKWADSPPPDPNVRRGVLGEPLEGSSMGGTEAQASLVKPTEWSLDLIRDLEWKRFENVCQQFYEKKGIRSETTALGPDGGIDIRLYQDDSGRPTSIVQCKAWGERFVGVKPVRELLGVMTHERIEKAFFMTSGSYSEEAKSVAQANRITLIDGTMLLMMIQRLSAEERESLLVFATEGEYKTPTCPTCGIKMKAVSGKGGRPDFWGCRNYPRCRQKLGMRRAQSAY